MHTYTQLKITIAKDVKASRNRRNKEKKGRKRKKKNRTTDTCPQNHRKREFT